MKRNADRFPADFMFQLTKEEAEALRFQIGMSKLGQHDQKSQVVFEAIRQLMTPPPEPEKKRRIGFAR